MFIGTPCIFKGGDHVIETPCIFQGVDHVYLDTLYISGSGSCLFRHPVYFREWIMFI